MAFYKLDSGDLLSCDTTLYFPDGTFLDASEPSGTVNGWQWFDNEATARIAFGLPPTPETLQ